MEIKRKLNRKSNRKSTDTSVDIQQFIKRCKLKNLRPRTIESYLEKWSKFDKWLDGRDLTKSVIEDYILHLKGSGIKDTTINTELRHIRTIINYFNLHIKITLLKVDESIKETYTDKDLQLLLNKPSNKCSFPVYRNWVIVNFLLGTGARASTVCNIRLIDLDLDDGTIRFTHTKNRKLHSIPLTRKLITILLDYVEEIEGITEWLFPNQYGNQLTVDTLWGAITNYNKSRGVYSTGLHKFRHTYAKLSIKNGMNVFQLQKFLGHSDLTMTRKYVNLFSDDLRDNLESVNPLERLSNNRLQRK